MTIKYVLFNSVFVFVVAFLTYFYGAFNMLYEYDITRVSFLILGIYAASTIYLGIKRNSANLAFIHFISNRLTSLGLVGTVIGIYLLLHAVGTTNLSDISQVVPPLFKGMSTVLVTTLFGMLFSILMDFQIAFVYGNNNEDD